MKWVHCAKMFCGEGNENDVSLLLSNVFVWYRRVCLRRIDYGDQASIIRNRDEKSTQLANLIRACNSREKRLSEMRSGMESTCTANSAACTEQNSTAPSQHNSVPSIKE
jgi:hypothetical protein